MRWTDSYTYWVVNFAALRGQILSSKAGVKAVPTARKASMRPTRSYRA